MTRRAFYTDPLAAAWMAKHFGFRLLCYLGGRGYDFHTAGDAALYEPTPESPPDRGRYYVHPDSLHLLEPQRGDAITDGETVGRVHPHRNEPRLSAFWAGNECETRLDGTERVIRRDGVPFMWPEFEP